MSSFRHNRRAPRPAKADWSQSGLALVIVLFPIVLCLVLVKFSGTPLMSFTMLLPSFSISSTLALIESIARSPNPWQELIKGFQYTAGEANPSPVISPAAEKLPSAVCSVPEARLAVLEQNGAFNRDIQAPLRDTKFGPDWTELQHEPLGANLKDCVFAAHDEAFNRLIGPKPVVRRLAQRDYPFAHEVS